MIFPTFVEYLGKFYRKFRIDRFPNLVKIFQEVKTRIDIKYIIHNHSKFYDD